MAQRRLSVSPSRVDSIVEAHRVSNHVPAIGLFIGTTGGRRLYERGYGTARVNPAVAADVNSTFLLASISKPYAATVALRLTELGKIDMRAPVSRYLSNLPGWGDTVSVRQLLAHSSGILDLTDVPGWSDTAIAETYMERAIASPLRFRPGKSIEYSNTNYALVQQIIERVTGESYSATAERLVIRPLRLMHTHFRCAHSSTSDLVEGNRWNGEQLTVVPPIASTHTFDAVGGMCASASDVAKFFSAILAGRVISRKSADEMHTVEGGDPQELRFGAGMGVARETAGEVWSHGGASSGGNTEVAIWPKDSLIIVVLASLGGGESEALSREIARSILGLKKAPVMDLPLKIGSGGRYAGRYALPNGRMIVSEKDGIVYLFGERCYNQGEDVFVCDPGQSRTLRFVGDGAGISEAWLMIEGVRRLRGVRAHPGASGG